LRRSNSLNLASNFSSIDHDGGSSSASAGKNGSEGGRGSQVIHCNRFTMARARAWKPGN